MKTEIDFGNKNEVREVQEYLRGLQEGDEVIETGQSCMTGKTGVVYIKNNLPCVRWEDGMGTSATWGTRRIKDLPPPKP